MTLFFRDIIKSIIEQLNTAGYSSICLGLCYQDESGKILEYSGDIEKKEATISDNKGDYFYIREMNSDYKIDWNIQAIGACNDNARVSNSFKLVYIDTNIHLDTMQVSAALYNAMVSINTPKIPNAMDLFILPKKINHNFRDIFENETKKEANSQNVTLASIEFDIEFIMMNCNLPKIKLC
jgi:hypothetical protein